jgi:hypothetical protein
MNGEDLDLDVLICLHLYLWGKMKEGKDEEVGRRGGWPRIVFYTLMRGYCITQFPHARTMNAAGLGIL